MNTKIVSTERLRSRRVLLRPIMQEDVDFLYLLATDPETGYRWRLRGSTPSRAEFERVLWDQVHVQFLIVTTDAKAMRVGLASCFAADLHSGHAQLAMILSPPFIARGLLADVGLLFVDLLFQDWPFRKLYVQMPDFVFRGQERGLARFFTYEGCLAGHHYHDGRYFDSHILSTSRELWSTSTERLRSQLIPASDAIANRSYIG